MIKAITLKYDPKKIFFISDPHFNHNLPAILKSACVETVEELNESRIAIWNANVPEDAIVFLLGDVCLHDPKAEIASKILKRLNFRKLYMLWGNHNSGVKNLYLKAKMQFFNNDEKKASAYEVYPLSLTIGDKKDIIFAGSYLEAYLGACNSNMQHVVMCHYPIQSWHGENKGSWMLCGHTHGNTPNLKPDSLYGKILEVTYEVIGGPLSLDDIKRVMDKKRTKANHRDSGDTSNKESIDALWQYVYDEDKEWDYLDDLLIQGCSPKESILYHAYSAQGRADVFFEIVAERKAKL